MKKTIISIILVTILFLVSCTKPKTEIVATYESTLDNIQVDYDDEKQEYDVFVDGQHHFVSEDNIKVLPYYKNEVVFEIDSKGQYKLYFYIKYEVEEWRRKSVI